MRKPLHSDLRAPRPLRLEMFEDRCLLSGANSLLTSPLFSPVLVLPLPVMTPVLTRLAPPAASSPGLTGPTTVINVLDSAATAAAGLNLNTGVNLNLGPVIAPIVTNGLPGIAPALGVIGNTPGASALVIVTGSVSPSVPGVAGVTGTPNFQVFIGAQGTPT